MVCQSCCCLEVPPACNKDMQFDEPCTTVVRQQSTANHRLSAVGAVHLGYITYDAAELMVLVAMSAAGTHAHGMQ